MKKIARPLTVLVIAALVWPWPSLLAASEYNNEPGPDSDNPVDRICEIGGLFAQDPEKLVENAAFGDREGLSGRGMIIPSRLAAAVHCAESGRLGLEPDRSSISNILDRKVTYVALIEPVKDLRPEHPDSARILLDDGRVLEPIEIYSDMYAQPDRDFKKNKTLWHRTLMEFPDPPAGTRAGRLRVTRAGESREHHVRFSLPERPGRKDAEFKTAAELVPDIWQNIRTWCQFKTVELRELEIERPSTGSMEVEPDKIRISRDVLYNTGYDDSAIAAMLLDGVNYAYSSEMQEVKVDTLEDLKLVTSVIGGIAGVVGVVYLDAQSGWEFLNSATSFEEVLGMLFLGGFVGVYLLSGPFRIALHYMPEKSELDINGATLSRMVLMRYDPWGYVSALDGMYRYGDAQYLYGNDSFASAASLKRQIDIIECMGRMAISTDGYWRRANQSGWNLANDLVRLAILKQDAGNLSMARSGEEHLLRPAKFRTGIEGASQADEPYMTIRYHEGLRWLNHEQWRINMKMEDMGNY